MALTQLTKVDGGGISTTSDYRVGIITASKFVGPFDGSGGNFSGVVTATNGVFSGNISAVDGNFSGNVTIGGTLTYEDVTNIDSVGIITAQKDIHVGAGVSAVGVGTFGSLDINGDIDVDGHTNLDNVSIAGITTMSGNLSLESTYPRIYLKDTNHNPDFSILNNDGNLGFRDDTNGEYRLQILGTGETKVYHNLIVDKDIDVDGHTELDNVAIAGVTTHYDQVFIRQIGSANSTNVMPLRVQANKGSTTTGIATALYESTFGIRPEFVFRQNHNGNWNNSNGQTQHWRMVWKAPDETNTTDELVELKPHTDIAGALSYFLIRTTDNSTGLKNSGLFSSQQVLLYANNTLGFRLSQAGIGITDTIYHENDTDTKIRFPANDTIRFETAGSQRLNIASNGNISITNDLDVDGHTNLDNVSIAGITTFTENVFLSKDLDVDGHTNLDNVSIAGFTTFSQNINVLGSMTGQSVVLNAGSPTIFLNDTDTDSDFSIQCNGGLLKFMDTTNSYAVRLSINSSGNVSIAKDLDVDGHTNLDNVSIAGITTFSEDTKFIGALSGRDLQWDKSDNSLEFLDYTTARFGTDNNLTIYHNAGNNNSYISENGVGSLLIGASDLYLTNTAGEYYVICATDGRVQLNFDNSEKLRTTNTGIDVTGEVAATQDYPNIRPVLDFNFAATKKLRPEMTFTRDGEASFHDGVGSVKFVSDNEPRFEHDIVTGECKGLMFEQAGTNYSWYSRRFDAVATASWIKINSASITANTHTAPDGTSSGLYMADTISGATGTTVSGNVVRQQWTAGTSVKHTVSIYVKLLTATQATIYLRDANTGSTQTASAANIKGWQRLVVTSSNAMTASVNHSWFIGNTNGTIAVWGSQIERSDYVTSYIKTTGGANGTRNADKGVRLDGEDVTDIFNDGRGTLIAEAILTQSQSNNPIVGFYENFTDDNRVELRGDASSVGTARFEAVVNDSAVASLTTGLTHSGVNNVSKYAYAFELNNYAGCVNGGTVATDTGGAFPSGMDSMMIGEAVYNVDASVIVKRIMYYADRLPNSQLVTLTS